MCHRPADPPAHQRTLIVQTTSPFIIKRRASQSRIHRRQIPAGLDVAGSREQGDPIRKVSRRTSPQISLRGSSDRSADSRGLNLGDRKRVVATSVAAGPTNHLPHISLAVPAKLAISIRTQFAVAFLDRVVHNVLIGSAPPPEHFPLETK